MDEPLSSLDEETRERMVDLLKGLPQKVDVTVLHITHSRHEAEQLGDLIFRLHEGRIEVHLPASASTRRFELLTSYCPDRQLVRGAFYLTLAERRSPRFTRPAEHSAPAAPPSDCPEPMKLSS